MCHFISVGTSKKGNAELPKRRGFRVFRQENVSISRSLPADCELWVITCEGCSCCLCLSDESKPDRLRLRDDAVAYVSEVVRERGPVHLLIHWYSGDLSSEKIAASKGRDVSLRELPGNEFEPDLIFRLREG